MFNFFLLIDYLNLLLQTACDSRSGKGLKAVHHDIVLSFVQTFSQLKISGHSSASPLTANSGSDFSFRELVFFTTLQTVGEQICFH